MSILKGIIEEIDEEINKIKIKINKENAPFLSQHLNSHEICNAQIEYLKGELLKTKEEIKRLREER